MLYLLNFKIVRLNVMMYECRQFTAVDQPYIEEIFDKSTLTKQLDSYHHLDQLKWDVKQKTEPVIYRGQYSFNSLVLREITENPGDWSVLHRLLYLCHINPTSFREQYNIYDIQWCQLLLKILKSADIIISTFVMIDRLSSEDFNIIDIMYNETGCIPESLWLYLVTTFPHTFVRFMVGDPVQYTYEVTSRDIHREKDTDKKFLTSYASQLVIFYIYCYIESGLPIAELLVNKRCRNSLHIISSAVAYHDEMTSFFLTRDIQPQDFEMFTWLNSINPQGMNNLLWIDFPNIYKEIVGINVINAIYVCYIWKLIVNIFQVRLRMTTTIRAKVLVVISYNVQYQLLKHHIATFHPAEYVPQLVDIHIIQGVIGSEADIVIVDLTYITYIRYTNRHDLINITISRARTMFIVVGRHSIFFKRKGINKFGNLQTAFCIFERSQAVIEFKGYHFICDRYYTSHSYSTGCTVKCANYTSQAHHTCACKATP